MAKMRGIHNEIVKRGGNRNIPQEVFQEYRYDRSGGFCYWRRRFRTVPVRLVKKAGPMQKLANTMRSVLDTDRDDPAPCRAPHHWRSKAGIRRLII